MEPLDLRPLRPDLNALILVDACEVWRDAEGTSDDVIDPVTGSIIPGVDRVLVHTTNCGVKHVFRGVIADEAGEPVEVGEYEVKFPGGIADVKPGDAIKVTSSPHDPTMVGKWFRVEERLHGSLSLFTKVRAELRERASDRP